MSIPTTATQVLKVVSIDDLGINIVELPCGVYLIDGEVVSNTGFNSYNVRHQVSAKDVENIRAIFKTNVLLEYQPVQDGITDDLLSVESYKDFIAELKSAADYSDEYGEVVWNNLEAEFEYRRFVSQWKAVYKEETSYSEPLLIDRSHVRQDSGNPYIVAGFLTGKADVPLYEYNRTLAVESLLHAKFKSLGFEFKEGLSYSQTEGKKLYSNSTHSGLEYVTAFGKYIMPKADLPKTRGTFRGSFEHLESIYANDKEWIESLIQTGYNLHFRNEQASGVVINYDNNEYQQGAYGGMSLRDYFAAKALQGMTSLFDGGASLEEIEASLPIVTTLSHTRLLTK